MTSSRARLALSSISLILSFIAVPSPSIFSKPSDPFTVDVDASASAGGLRRLRASGRAVIATQPPRRRSGRSAGADDHHGHHSHHGYHTGHQGHHTGHQGHHNYHTANHGHSQSYGHGWPYYEY